MRLFWKIYLLSLFSLLFCSVLLTAIVSYRDAKSSLARMQADQRVLAITAASQVESGYFDQVWPFEMLSGISREPDFVSWQIVGGDGRVVLASSTDVPALAVAEAPEPQLVEIADSDNEMWVVPMRMRDGAKPWQFRLGYHTRAVRAQLRSTILTNATIGFALAVLFIGTSLVVTHRVLRPLNSLTRAVGELERGNLEVTLPDAGSDEIGALVAGFSAMVQSIRDRDRKIYEQLESLAAARDELESRVDERTRDLQTSQARLVDASRRAGMAEVASNVLHNVGNVLTSVNVSASMLEDQLNRSRMPQLAKVAGMLADRRDTLGAYLTSDERGKLIPGYLVELGGRMIDEQRALLDEVRSLTKDIDSIKRIVATQQSYAKLDIDVSELVAIDDLTEDALRISAGGVAPTIDITRELQPTPKIRLDRHKVVHILVNLLNNAKDAVAKLGAAAQIRLRIAMDGDRSVRVDVADNGVGIAADHLQRIFNHGFTTKLEGHGFGLHGAALSAKQMRGSLTAHSDGEGHGARFSLVLPVDP